MEPLPVVPVVLPLPAPAVPVELPVVSPILPVALPVVLGPLPVVPMLPVVLGEFPVVHPESDVPVDPKLPVLKLEESLIELF